jgi:hypothetical protein
MTDVSEVLAAFCALMMEEALRASETSVNFC